MRTTADGSAPSHPIRSDLDVVARVEFNAETELVVFAFKAPERDLVVQQRKTGGEKVPEDVEDSAPASSNVIDPMAALKRSVKAESNFKTKRLPQSTTGLGPDSARGLTHTLRALLGPQLALFCAVGRTSIAFMAPRSSANIIHPAPHSAAAIGPITNPDAPRAAMPPNVAIRTT